MWSDKLRLEGIERFLFCPNKQKLGAQGEYLHSSTVAAFPEWGPDSLIFKVL